LRPLAGAVVASAVLALVLSALAGAQETGRPGPLSDPFLDRLVGRWDVTRRIRGTTVKNTAQAQWVLGHRFVELHLKDAADPPQYEALVRIGFDASTGRYVAHWTDTFGGQYSAIGYGQRQDDSIDFVFGYADGPFHNTFTWRPADGMWRSLMEAETGGGRRFFAEDVYRRGATAAPSRTLLAVFAHPDDEGLVGPLLAAYARRGVRVRLAIVTDGAQGARPHAGIAAGPALAAARAEEARCACRALGIDAPLLLGFGDGELGRAARPSWAPLADVERAIAKVFEEVRPDAVVTFGPEGGYGHPDHRLVGAVVTQLVQKAADGAPAALFYPGLPGDHLPRPAEGQLPWSATDPRFLTVRVPFEAADSAAARAALACHKTQFTPDELVPLARMMEQVLGVRVWLRPWFGDARGDDLFAPPTY